MAEPLTEEENALPCQTFARSFQVEHNKGTNSGENAFASPKKKQQLLQLKLSGKKTEQ